MAQFEDFVMRMVPDLQRDFGCSEDDAYAILGNMGHESNGLRQLQEVAPIGGGRGGLGGFQWTGPRRVQFEAYCKEHKLGIGSYEATYGFLYWELTHTEKAMPRVMAAKGLYNKTMAFELAFERANKKYKFYDRRYAWAQKAKAYYEAHAAQPVIPVLPEPEAPQPDPIEVVLAQGPNPLYLFLGALALVAIGAVVLIFI